MTSTEIWTHVLYGIGGITLGVLFVVTVAGVLLWRGSLVRRDR